jgi:broad specificity phosphatase PhoE
LIVVRHAHRDKAEGKDKDNGLSEKGRRQAARIAARFGCEFVDERALVISSPKKRCRETVEGLGVKVQSFELLDEEGPDETWEKFNQRIEQFMTWWVREAPPLVVACSHGDWIPAFLRSATKADIELSKGGWAELTLTDGDVRLEWLLQKLA